MYNTNNLVQKTVVTCVWMQSHPEIPLKIAFGYWSERGGTVSIAKRGIEVKGKVRIGIDSCKVEGDVRQVAGYKCGIVTMPIRQLRDAAHRDAFQIVQGDN